jgi:uncharacterized LabA/DUF88 family protein
LQPSDFNSAKKPVVPHADMKKVNDNTKQSNPTKVKASKKSDKQVDLSAGADLLGDALLNGDLHGDNLHGDNLSSDALLDEVSVQSATKSAAKSAAESAKAPVIEALTAEAESTDPDPSQSKVSPPIPATVGPDSSVEPPDGFGESPKNALSRAASFQPNYPTADQSSDRIAIFIDGSNLFYAASHLNIEVDYRRLLAALVRGRRLLRAYFYTGVDPQNEKQRGFLLWLNRHGHRVVSKELTHLPDGSRKANMHVEMAVDMMRIAEHCSTLTLLGGDGNLAYALQVLSQRGISIEVVSLQSMTSDSLIDLADSYIDLADLRNQIKR